MWPLLGRARPGAPAIQGALGLPLCGESWEVLMRNGSIDPNRELSRAIQDVLQNQSLPMTIRFEIDGEEAGG